MKDKNNNTGNWNSGDQNSGNWNSGDQNSGNRNSGDQNSGNRNSGYWNSGYGNSTNRETGIFNTTAGKIRCFNLPTDGLIEGWEKRLLALWPEDVEIDKRSFPAIRTLLAEQKKKTREDTLNNIEAIWTRLMNETDDPAYKEVYTRCIKALKI